MSSHTVSNVYMEKLASLSREEILRHLVSIPSLFKKLSSFYQNDFDVALVACIHNPAMMEFASHEIKQSKEFFLSFVEGAGKNKLITTNDILSAIHQFSPSKFMHDKDCCIKMLYYLSDKNETPIALFSDRIKNDYEVAKKAVSLSPSSYKNIGEFLKDVVELACMASVKDAFAYSYASDRLKTSGVLLDAIYKKSVGMFYQVVFVNRDEIALEHFQRLDSGRNNKESFYLNQFKKEEKLILKNKKEFNNGSATGIWVSHEQAMKHIVDRLTPEQITLLVPMTELGKEAIFNNAVKVIPQSGEVVQKKKERRIKIGR